MSLTIGIMADLLVAVLLVATILTSMRLSGRIRTLKTDESVLRRTVAELVVATDTAERAIAGLRSTLGECDRTLAERLKAAELYADTLGQKVEAGEGVIARIAQIVETSRPLAPERAPEKPAPGDALRAMAAAAQAVAERAAQRLEGRAAA